MGEHKVHQNKMVSFLFYRNIFHELISDEELSLYQWIINCMINHYYMGEDGIFDVRNTLIFLTNEHKTHTYTGASNTK